MTLFTHTHPHIQNTRCARISITNELVSTPGEKSLSLTHTSLAAAPHRSPGRDH